MATVRPTWAINSVVIQVNPLIHISSPMDNNPVPPTNPAASVLQGAARIGTAFGSEPYPGSTLKHISTAVSFFVKRNPASNTVWVLEDWVQTAHIEPSMAVLAASNMMPPVQMHEVQQFQPHTLRWSVWQPLSSFATTTTLALQARRFRMQPVPAFGVLPDQHRFFTGTWSRYAYDMSIMEIRHWVPIQANILRACTPAANNANVPPQLSSSDMGIWINNTHPKGENDDDGDED